MCSEKFTIGAKVTVTFEDMAGEGIIVGKSANFSKSNTWLVRFMGYYVKDKYFDYWINETYLKCCDT